MATLRLDIPTVAITGSAGKTTTKEMIASILAEKWKVFKSYKNNNNPYLHTKKHAQMIDSSHEAVVLEYGMSREGFGRMHCSYIEPNISIITSIGFAHIGALGGQINKIAEAKSAIFKYMKPTGTLLINKDDEYSGLLNTNSFKGEIISIGIKNEADYQASHVRYLENGMSFQVMLDQQPEQFFIPCFGSHNVLNALFAIAVSHRLQFTAAEMREGLAKFERPVRRLFVKYLRNDSIIIDDSYSANPHAVKAAIGVLNEIAEDRKKVAILGSMLELGQLSRHMHEDIGNHLVRNNVDLIITYGKDAEYIARGAIAAGHCQDAVYSFHNRDELHEYLKQINKSNTVFLVKGSNGMRMNETVRFLIKTIGKKRSQDK